MKHTKLIYGLHPINYCWILFCPILFITSCKKMLDIGAPTTSTNAAIVFNTDAIAISAVTGCYTALSNINYTSGLPTFSNLSLFAGLTADEFTLYSGASGMDALNRFYNNSLTQMTNGEQIWIKAYSIIFNANAAISGLNTSNELTPAVKKQLLGESKFMRAFCYYYLVNLYGGVPLVLTTDYKINNTLPRSSEDQVYLQIIQDLKDAQNDLSIDFLSGTLLNTTTERVRPTKWAAMALLARAYLAHKDWAAAENMAGLVIGSNSLFSLSSLSNTFLKNSSEAIWQLQPVITGQNTPDAMAFIIPVSGPTNSPVNPVFLTTDLLGAFEPGDLRKTNWISSVTVGATTYPFPYKYKLNTSTAASASEYIMVLRLAEQYLIRAEARIQQEKISDGIADLNEIRGRATNKSLPVGDPNRLPALSLNLGKDEALKAVLKERRLELFTEWGHRWLDLKRTKMVNEVMQNAAILKGGTWNADQALYPIPVRELTNNPNLTQNPGY